MDKPFGGWGGAVLARTGVWSPLNVAEREATGQSATPTLHTVYQTVTERTRGETAESMHRIVVSESRGFGGHLV